MAGRNISVQVWKTVFAFGVVAGIVILIFWAQSALLLAFLGVLLAVLFDAIAGFGTRWLKLPRGVAVILSALLFLLGLGGILCLITLPLLREGTELIHSLPEKTALWSQELQTYRKEYPMLQQVLPASKPQSQSTGKSGSSATQAAKKVLITGSTALEWLARLLATFFFALFLAWNPDRWIRGVAELWPADLVERRVALFRSIGSALRSYLLTVGVSMIAMAGMWTLGLWLIGIKFALLFGALAGVVEVVPYVGPVLGFIPPLLYSLSNGGMKPLYVLLLYCVLHIVEAYLLVPYVLHERERFPPPLVVLSILLGGTVFGALGVVLAVPLGTAVYVWVQESVYKTRTSH